MVTDKDYFAYQEGYEISCKNCVLSDDKQYITIDCDCTYAYVNVVSSTGKDDGPYSSNLDININNVDCTAPKLEITYSTTQPTDKDVTVTIKADEEIKDVEGFTKKGHTLTKVYSENQEEEVEVYDLAGNKAIAKINVNNINKLPQEPEETTTEPETTTKPEETTTEPETTTKPEEITTEIQETTKFEETTVSKEIETTTVSQVNEPSLVQKKEETTTAETKKTETNNTTLKKTTEKSTPKTGDKLSYSIIAALFLSIGVIVIIGVDKKKKEM